MIVFEFRPHIWRGDPLFGVILYVEELQMAPGVTMCARAWLNAFQVDENHSNIFSYVFTEFSSA
jgi:hypothetical protein